MSRTWIVCLAAFSALAIACGGSVPTSPSRTLGGSPSSATTVSASSRSALFGAGAADFGRCLQGQPDAGCFSAARIETRAVGAAATAPGAPVNLSTSSSAGTVTLTWGPPASGDPVTSYVIEAGSGPGLSNLANFGTNNTATTFSASGVPAGTYYVRIRAQNAGGTSAPSNESILVVGGSGCTAPPNPPTGLTSSVSGGTVTLTWAAPTGGCPATSYVLQAGSSAGLSNLANANVGNTTSYVANGVGAGTYYVRVVAQNATGASGASNENTVTVGSSPNPLFTKSGSGNTTFTLPATVANVRITGSYTDSFPSCQNFIVYITYHVVVNEILGTCSYRTAGPTIDRTVPTYGGGDVSIVGSLGVGWTFTEVR